MANRYWVGGTGTWDAISTANWSASTGGAGGASVPVAADVVYFDANSGGGTCSVASTAVANTVDMAVGNTTVVKLSATGLTVGSQFIHRQGTLNLNGFTLTTGVFYSNTNAVRTIDFGSTGKVNITRTASVSYAVDLYQATTKVTILGNALFDLIGNAPSTTTFGVRTPDGSFSANPVSFKFSNGQATLALGGDFYFGSIDYTGYSGTLNVSSLSIFVQGSLTLSPTMTLPTPGANWYISFVSTTSGNTITLNGKTFTCDLRFNGVGGEWNCTDALTQTAGRVFSMQAGTLRLKNGATSTVSAFATSGTAQKFLESTLAGSQATLSQASGTVNASNLTIKDINATGGATWNAFVTNGNVDAGNNTGWDFFAQLGKYIYTRRKNKRILL